MRGVIELILAIGFITGGSYKALDLALYARKEVAARKILDQPKRSLSAATKRMTGKKLSQSPHRLLEKN